MELSESEKKKILEQRKAKAKATPPPGPVEEEEELVDDETFVYAEHEPAPGLTDMQVEALMLAEMLMVCADNEKPYTAARMMDARNFILVAAGLAVPQPAVFADGDDESGDREAEQPAAPPDDGERADLFTVG